MKDLKEAISTKDEIKIAKFQDNLSDLMNLYNITGAELGKMIGVTRQQIYNIKKNITRMTKSQYIAIMAIFAFGESDIEKIFNDSKTARLLSKEYELKEMKKRLET